MTTKMGEPPGWESCFVYPIKMWFMAGVWGLLPHWRGDIDLSNPSGHLCPED